MNDRLGITKRAPIQGPLYEPFFAAGIYSKPATPDLWDCPIHGGEWFHCEQIGRGHEFLDGCVRSAAEPRETEPRPALRPVDVRTLLKVKRAEVHAILKAEGLPFPESKWASLRKYALRRGSVTLLELELPHRIETLLAEVRDPALERRRKSRERREREALRRVRQGERLQAEAQRDYNGAVGDGQQLPTRELPMQPSQKNAYRDVQLGIARSEKAKARLYGQKIFTRALSVIGKIWDATGEQITDPEVLRAALTGEPDMEECLSGAEDPEATLERAISMWTQKERLASQSRAAAGGRSSSRRKMPLADYMVWKMEQPENISKAEEAHHLGVSTAAIGRYRAEMNEALKQSLRDIF